MAAVAFDFLIEVRSRGAVLHTAPASTSACLEDALFRGVVQGRFANDGALPSFELAPEWREGEPPAAAGLTLSHPDTAPIRYDAEVFAPQAHHLIQCLLRSKRLEPETPVEWSLVARPAQRRGAPVRVTRAPFPLTRRELSGPFAGPLRVAFEPDVLDVIRRAVLDAGGVERAGLLLGTLFHDRERAAALLRVAAQVPLEVGRGGASESHFALDPASFLAARQAAAHQAPRLIHAGWWHLHPPPCAACMQQPRCEADSVFFSASDEWVHATAFPRAFMVALVAGKLQHLPARQPGFRLYGWESGRMVQRGFRILGLGADGFHGQADATAREES